LLAKLRRTAVALAEAGQPRQAARLKSGLLRIALLH